MNAIARMTDIDVTSQMKITKAASLMYGECRYIAQMQHSIVPSKIREPLPRKKVHQRHVPCIDQMMIVVPHS